MKTLKGMKALVTGASSGIGEAIARRLAHEGVDVVLVARNEERLRALANVLSVEHGVRAEAIVADLTKPKQGEDLLAQTDARGIAVDILVNSAGFGTYGPFESLDPQREQNEVAVNVAAVVDLAHAFLPQMLERRRGAILNVASTAAFQPGPYMAVYAATKAFVLSFSEALWAECRERGVHVVALCPGAVDTPFISALGDDSARETAIFSHLLHPDDVAIQALRALRGTAPTRVVGLRNRLMVQSLRFAPRAFVARTGERMLRPRRLVLAGRPDNGLPPAPAGRAA